MQISKEMEWKSSPAILIFSHALVSTVSSSITFLRFRLSKNEKICPLKKSQEEEHKMRKKHPTCTCTGANIICATQPWQVSFLNSDRTKVYYPTGYCLHFLSNSFFFETPFFSSVTSLLLFRELHAAVVTKPVNCLTKFSCYLLNRYKINTPECHYTHLEEGGRINTYQDFLFLGWQSYSFNQFSSITKEIKNRSHLISRDTLLAKL